MVSRTDTLVDSRVGSRPLFSVGDAVYTWGDVVARARAAGELAAIEGEVRAGLAALRRTEPEQEDVEAVARAFRYERGLLAGDELDAWFESRGLTAAEWHEYLSRVLAREAVPDVDGSAEDPVPHVWAEGICSGVFEAIAHKLALLVAVAPDAPAERRDEEYEAFCRAAATDAAIEREIESNRLQWIRLRYDVVAFADEDTAGEAALCVRADGEPLADVAARIGADVEQRDDWLEDVEPELASRFFAAEERSLVGPVAADEGSLLAFVHAKTPPALEDEDVRARAAGALAQRAAERAVNERVTWLEPL